MINGDFNNVLPVDLVDPQQVQEFVDHAWYRYPNDQVGRHPFDGITDPWYNPGDVKGSDTNIQQLNEQERYSWIKAPRWRGNAMVKVALSSIEGLTSKRRQLFFTFGKSM